MIIHFSILIVIVLVGTIYNRPFRYKKLNYCDYVMPRVPWLIVFGYITFLAGMRSSMNDTSVYVTSFEQCRGTVQNAISALMTMDSKYRFTEFLQNLFKCFVSQDYHMWFLLWAIIETICFIHIYRRECYDIMVPCFFFFSSTLYYNYFSMMRQWMAVSIVFGSFGLLKRKKWIPYILCCSFAAQFHPSAYFCILFAFLAVGKPWRKKQNFIIVGASIAIVFMRPILNSLEADEATYGYVIETMQTNSGSSPVRVLIAIVPVIFAFWYRKQIERENDIVVNICVNMSVLHCILNVVATVTSGLYLVRLATYLSPYNAILYSVLLQKIIKGNNRKVIVPGFFIFYFLFYYYQMTYQGAWYYGSDILGKFY